MNFSGIPRSSLVGRMLRWPLSLIPASARMPVLQGPLRGWWWIVGSGIHGYWLGSFEQAMSRHFARGIQPGDIVYDVGANAGYYTLLAAAATGKSGRVIAFEPLPENLEFLRRHLALNHLQQVEVFDAAVSDQTGETFFEVATDRSMGKISGHGSLPVRLVTLDGLVAAGRIPPPDCIKVDLEGAEVQVLAGARTVLAQSGPDIYLAIHGPDQQRACRRILAENGYRLTAMNGLPIDETAEIYATRKEGR